MKKVREEVKCGDINPIIYEALDVIIGWVILRGDIYDNIKPSVKCDGSKDDDVLLNTLVSYVEDYEFSYIDLFVGQVWYLNNMKLILSSIFNYTIL